MICDLQKLLVPRLCGPDRIGGTLARVLERNVRKAVASLKTAERSRHRAKLLERATRRLEAIVRASTAERGKDAGKHATAPACQARIARMVEQRRGRLAALRS
jgi:hypothetical protein